MARYYLGTAHYLRNEWAQAQPYLLALLKDPALVDSNYLSFGAFALALIYHGQGRQAEADEVIATLGAYLSEIGARAGAFHDRIVPVSSWRYAGALSSRPAG